MVNDLGSIVQLAEQFDMLEPLHGGSGTPVGTVLALRLRVGRNLKRGSVHSEGIWFGSIHRLDSSILHHRASEAKEFVRLTCDSDSRWRDTEDIGEEVLQAQNWTAWASIFAQGARHSNGEFN